MMKIEKIEPSKHKKNRILIFLEDGSLLKVTDRELLSFSLRTGDDLDDETLASLRNAAQGSNAKAEAAVLIGRRAMSRADLEGKLRDKGASANDARYAAEWLEAIGALNDADYARLLIRHYAALGYGPARFRMELHKHGIDRSLWEEAMDAAPAPSEIIDRFLCSRFRRGAAPDERELKRTANTLVRRGFYWGDVKDALRRYTESLPEKNE